MQNDLIGRRLGPFEIREFAGNDEQVEVYQGIETQSSQPVTIKLALEPGEPDPVFNTRFRREARALAGLRHPNIARLLDFGQIEGGHYMVLEAVEGVSLASLLEEVRAGERILESADIAFIIRQVAGALDHAHRSGIVHLDLRPEHIMLTRTGQAIVTNFGVALLGSQNGPSGDGVTSYMAPEQIADQRAASPASDIYALGVILYEIVTGELPFADDSEIDTLMRDLGDSAPDPRLLDSHVSSSMTAVLLKALAKSPGQRFRTAMQLASTLERAYAHPDMGEALIEAAPKARPATLEDERAGYRRPEESPEERRERRRLQAEHNRITRAETWRRRRIWWQGFRVKWGRTMLVMGIVFLLLLAVGYLLQTVGILKVAIALPTIPTRVPQEEVVADASVTPFVPPDTPTPHIAPTDLPEPTPLVGVDATPVTPIVFATLDVGSTAFRIVDGQVMVFVPAGQFLMGTNVRDRSDNSKPQHTVTLGDYWIDQTEITNDQYRLCRDAEVCPSPAAGSRIDLPDYGNYPVTHVSYESAVAYCLWVATQTGQVIGLPTEAQWEKAAGWDPIAQTQRTYPWGDEPPTPDRLRYIESNSIRPAAPVGTHPLGASAYHALDMAGNVWEWTADWFDPTYYRRTGVSLDPTGPITGTARATRGGAWTREARFAVTTVRNPVGPSTASDEIGFRCAMTAGRPPGESQIVLSPLDLIAALRTAIAAAQDDPTNDAPTLDEWTGALDNLAEALTEIDRTATAALVTERLERLATQEQNGLLHSPLTLRLENGLHWIQAASGTTTPEE